MNATPREHLAVTLRAGLPGPAERIRGMLTDDDVLEVLVDLLETHSGVFTVNTGADPWIEVVLTVAAADAPGAVAVATTIVRSILHSAGFTRYVFTAAEALSADEQAALNATPLIPALLGAMEVAELLGVSRQRVHVLAQRPDFPDPVSRLSATAIWTEPSLRAFMSTWRRQPGRPSDDRLAPVGPAAADGALEQLQ